MNWVTGIEGLQILANRSSCHPCFPDLVDTLNSPITPCIAADQTPVHGKAGTTNQASTTALPDNIFEEHAVDTALPESTIGGSWRR
jgi:hypothetical protein